MTDTPDRYDLRVAGPAMRQLDALPGKVAAAVVEFMLGPAMDEPHRVGGLLRRELAEFRAVRRGAYRVIYEADDDNKVVNVVRIDHRATAYRSR